ncbi:MAG: rod shape-determining protein MreC [Brevibacillus sp.]|nr:rod shape-determining protein MreC [Brevibacillus sp.]
MSFFGNKRLIIMLTGLVLLISVMGFTARERENLTWPEKFIKDTFSLMQGLFYRPAQAFSHFVAEVSDAYHVYQENRVLKASLDKYAQTTAQLKLLEAENARLRQLLDAKTRLHDYKLRVAEVVARNSDHWNDVITIDKGLVHGIQKDMAVITAQGLIGRVKSVANFSATVELLTGIENSNHLSAVVLAEKKTGDAVTLQQVSGVIEEYDPRQRLLIMRKIPLGNKLEPGQQVVTSGMGGVIPRGLLVGKVVGVEAGDYGLTQTVYVKPSADLTQLSEVMVVERAFVTTPDGQLVPSSPDAVNAGEQSEAVGNEPAGDYPASSEEGGRR